MRLCSRRQRLILVLAGGKLVLDMFYIGGHSTANIAAPIITDVVEEPEAPKPQVSEKPVSAPRAAPQGAPALPQAPNGFNAAPPSRGVIAPSARRRKRRLPIAQTDLASTGFN